MVEPDPTSAFANVLAPDAFGAFVDRQTRPVDALPTPWPGLNTECRGDGGREGLAYGWHVIIGGATNMGKSNLAVNLAARAAEEGHPVAFVSLEMARHQVQARLYSILTGEDSDRFARGQCDNSALRALREMGDRLTLGNGVPGLVLVNDRPVRNIYDISRSLARFHEDYGVRCFIVDYLQLVSTGTDEDRRRQVQEISAALMVASHEYEWLTIGLSQLNRYTSRERKISPEVEGLTESSSLENDADMVLLLDHSKYAEDAERPWIHRTFLKVAKNRHGGRGSIPLEWNWKNFRAREPHPDEEHLWEGIGRTP